MLNKKPKKPINISGATKKNAPGKGGGSDAARKGPGVIRKKPKQKFQGLAPPSPIPKKPEGPIRLKRGGKAKKNVK